MIRSKWAKHIERPDMPPCLTPEQAAVYVLDEDECRYLWAYLMKMAWVETGEWYPPRRLAAMQWFREGGKTVGGSQWICWALGLDYRAVMEKAEERYQEPTEADMRRYKRINRKWTLGGLTSKERDAILSGEEDGDEQASG